MWNCGHPISRSPSIIQPVNGHQVSIVQPVLYRITRMFCEHQTFANFDQFATIKSAKPKLLLVNTHDPCQNAIVRSQRVKFPADLAHSQRFFTSKIF